jgi:RsiW-degrading membrane proteinase PrsW (M82 family)
MTPDEEGITPAWLKRTVEVVGLLMAILGIPFVFGAICIIPMMAVSGSDAYLLYYGIPVLVLGVFAGGLGTLAYIQADRALRGKPSQPVKLPPLPALVGIFALLVLLGLAVSSNEVTAGLFFPLILIVVAALPPMWAIAWFVPRLPAAADQAGREDAQADPAARLTWRRGLLAFGGGATFSVVVAILLEVLLPAIVLVLVFGLWPAVSEAIGDLLAALAGADVAEALTGPGFLYAFLVVAVVAPLAEELAKPLVTLPLLKRLSRQEAFWLGALAGAGFATMENIIYASSGYGIWAGILVVRALGGALHPLCAGLVAMAWRDVLCQEPGAGRSWLVRFGSAVGLHAAWNGGSLLVITLGGARFFGDLPHELDVLGLSAAGTTLAFLIVLGLLALWAGRTIGQGKPLFGLQQAPADDTLTPSDRALAIWALVCLVVLVPAGIAGWKLWLP